jgi:hypothetical protein
MDCGRGCSVGKGSKFSFTVPISSEPASESDASAAVDDVPWDVGDGTLDELFGASGAFGTGSFRYGTGGLASGRYDQLVSLMKRLTNTKYVCFAPAADLIGESYSQLGVTFLLPPHYAHWYCRRSINQNLRKKTVQADMWLMNDTELTAYMQKKYAHTPTSPQLWHRVNP